MLRYFLRVCAQTWTARSQAAMHRWFAVPVSHVAFGVAIFITVNVPSVF